MDAGDAAGGELRRRRLRARVGHPRSAGAVRGAPERDLIVDEEQGSDDLAPLAEAVEREVAPPYRAVGVLQEGDVWAVSAYPIDVLSFSFDAGDELELVARDGKAQLIVDGEPVSGSVPELVQAGSERGADYAVYADRLDGDLWEVRAAPL